MNLAEVQIVQIYDSYKSFSSLYLIRFRNILLLQLAELIIAWLYIWNMRRGSLKITLTAAFCASSAGRIREGGQIRYVHQMIWFARIKKVFPSHWTRFIKHIHRRGDPLLRCLARLQNTCIARQKAEESRRISLLLVTVYWLELCLTDYVFVGASTPQSGRLKRGEPAVLHWVSCPPKNGYVLVTMEAEHWGCSVLKLFEKLYQGWAQEHPRGPCCKRWVKKHFSFCKTIWINQMAMIGLTFVLRISIIFGR